MDLEKLTGIFDDDNVDRLKGLWEDKDRIADAVDWVLDHREDLLGLIDALPKLLGEVGGTMSAAGAGATEAAGLLTGEDGTSVKDLAAAAADEGANLMEPTIRAAKAGATTPLGAQAEALYALFNGLGYGGKDFSAMVQMLRGRLDTLAN